MAETLIFSTGSRIISGTLTSTASISQLNLDGVTGSFVGTGSALTGVVSVSHAIASDAATLAVSSVTALTSSHVAGGNVFGAVALADAAKGFTGSLDAVNTVDEGRWRTFTTTIPTAAESVQRTSLGLIFRDQFNRADSPDLENDWAHTNISQSISDNKFQHATGGPGSFAFFTGSTTANRFPTTGSLNLPTKYMVQGNVSMGGIAVGNFDITTRENTTDRTGPTGRYQVQLFHNSIAVRRIMKFFTSSNEILASAAFNAPSGAFFGERLILEDLGDSTLAVSGAWTLELSSSADLQAPFTAENLSALDTAITQSETNIIGFANQVGAALDEYIIQGTEVIVTDLPSGFKARLDSDANVVESGGSASISVRTKALPFATMSVLNASNVIVAQTFPQSASLADGWGGDTYAFAPATFQEYQLIPVSASGEEEPVALAIRRDGTLIVRDFSHSGSNLGFYTTTPIAQQTGVAVNDAAIHAALVALGLITP